MEIPRTYIIPKPSFTKEHIHNFPKDQNLTYLPLQFTHILPLIKNLQLPLTQLHKLLHNQIIFHPSSIEAFLPIQESHMYLYPHLD
ncbi:glutamine synthetase beta-grasp domain-containing protein, partial [Staphylococcus saprophyticus]|uniref:glutamine synthetase beta-grasp domain-containing protein n=1 Tax=Staphylococcus saprophyticus TaxID=29385 RepID=UPI0037044FDA